MPKVNIHHIKGKQLLIIGRSHAVIGDQPVQKGIHFRRNRPFCSWQSTFLMKEMVSEKKIKF